MPSELGPRSLRALSKLLRDQPPAVVVPSQIRDVVGTRVCLAQAPSGGIPARTGATPGSAVCTQVILAPLGGVGFAVGDLVKTTKTFTVLNWDLSVHGADGDRVVQVTKHSDNSLLVGASCFNEEDPDDILLYEPA